MVFDQKKIFFWSKTTQNPYQKFYLKKTFLVRILRCLNICGGGKKKIENFDIKYFSQLFFLISKFIIFSYI
jgi:hypothetical protein